MAIYNSLCLLLMVLLHLGSQLSPKGSEGIRDIIDSLPSGSHLRNELIDGVKGDNVHFSWMDDMRKQGVRRVLIEGRFVWHGHPTEITITRIIYSSKYTPDCSQITGSSLSEIRASGLEEKIQQLGIQRIAKAEWWRLDSPRDVENAHGTSYDELFDDERLPIHPPSLQQTDPHREGLVQSALISDENGVRQLAGKSSLKKTDLNSALFAASLGENSCLIKTLVNLGADVNAEGKDGNTPLMNAAGAGMVNNVRVLLQAGANVNAKDHYGRSVVAAAERSQHPEVVRVLLESRNPQ